MRKGKNLTAEEIQIAQIEQEMSTGIIDIDEGIALIEEIINQ